MSIYMTEEEQLDMIKQWWKSHQSWILSIVCVILIGCLGLQYNRMHRERVQRAASDTYEKLMQASAQHNDNQILSYAHHIMTEYPHTVYADVSPFSLSKNYL